LEIYDEDTSISQDLDRSHAATRDQPFKDTEVARNAVATYVTGLLKDPSRDIGGNIGISKPSTDGDRLTFV
jgi:hypothetical protein